MNRFIRVIYEAESKMDLDKLKEHYGRYVESEQLNNFVKYMRCTVRNIGYNLTDDDKLCGIEFDIKGPNYKDIENCIKYLKQNIGISGVKIKRQEMKLKGDILF